MRRLLLSAFVVVFLMCRSLLAADTGTAAPWVDTDHVEQMKLGTELFQREVRGILVGRCLICHGGESTESEFDLTTRDGLLKGGAEGKAVVLGQSSASRLVRLITHDEEPEMPQDGAKLSDNAIAAIRRWIDLGAPYDKPLVESADDPLAWTTRRIDESARQFWSFRPLQDVAPPPALDDWAKTPVDAFILRKLREHQLSPNESADRRTLIRRAYFDLIGLPPTPEQVAAFVNSDDPRAYETLVDQLLESPHYGERWGRHWLDIARFAESHGFEQDYDRPHAYHYRDFVIKALNQDMPFDQFVRWQIAGDEFAPDNPQAMMATGFLGAGVFPTQLTEKEFEPARYDELADMVGTLGTAMLGMTVGCARCHDHKFDPIPQADFYRMAAAFTTTIRSEIELDLEPEEATSALAKWEAEHAQLVADLLKFEQDELPDRYVKWLDSDELLEGRLDDVYDWIVLEPREFKSAGGAEGKTLDDGSLLVTGANPDFDEYTLRFRSPFSRIRAIRLEALPDPSMKKNGPGRADNGNFGLSRINVEIQHEFQKSASELTLQNPRATFEQNTSNLAIAASLDEDEKTGWAVDPQFGKRHAAVFDVPLPDKVESGRHADITVRLRFHVNNRHGMGRLRFSVSMKHNATFDGREVTGEVADALYQLAGSGSAALLDESYRTALREHYKSIDPEWVKRNKAVRDHLASKPQPQLTKVMVTSEGFKPIPHHADGRGFPHFYPQTYFLGRGDTEQKQGEASTGFLQVLMSPTVVDGNTDPSSHWMTEPPDEARTSYHRRALANWITDTEYGAGHLLARVIVNRLWQHHFGQGIVATPNDFGYQGQRPTHLELLDWLAGQLIANGWQLKPLHKLMMTSAVYTQTSDFDEADSQIDPDNRFLWRYEPRRLEAEIIRDAMLYVGGELDPTMYGPGSLDSNMKRRSIYFMVKRSKLMPMMQIFDAPEPLVSVGDRPATTIAPQALHFMNNDQVRATARSLARRLIEARDASFEDSVERAYLTTLSREPTDAERARSLAFLRNQAASYRGDQQASRDELALTDLCQVLFSLNEFVYVD